MCNSLNIKGGGYRPPADVILIKVKEFRRRNHRPEKISIDERRIIAYTLYQHFGFTHQQISEAYNYNIRPVRNDISLMEWRVKNDNRYREKVRQLYDYIIYNAKYIR